MTYLILSLTSSGVASRIPRWIASGPGCGLICGIGCGAAQISWWIIGSVVRVTHGLFNPIISH